MLNPNGRVVKAACITLECLKAVGGVEAAIGVRLKRPHSGGGVVGAQGRVVLPALPIKKFPNKVSCRWSVARQGEAGQPAAVAGEIAEQKLPVKFVEDTGPSTFRPRAAGHKAHTTCRPDIKGVLTRGREEGV